LITDTRDPKTLKKRPPSGARPSQEQLASNFMGNQNLKSTGGPTKNINSNILNAITGQNDQYGEVKQFLGAIKLDKYFDKMIDNGVEDLETILELEDSHIEQMGIPLGHKLKIMKKIKDTRADQGMMVPQSPAMSNSGTSNAGISNAGTEVSYGEGGSSRPATQI
jgi:hypothetical protein